MNREELSRACFLKQEAMPTHSVCQSHWRWDSPLTHQPALTYGIHEVNVVHKVPLSQVDSELGRKGTRVLVAVEQQNTGLP